MPLLAIKIESCTPDYKLFVCTFNIFSERMVAVVKTTFAKVDAF